MMALQFRGKDDVKVGEVPVPLITDPTDVLVKVTATTICGSDLHLYHNKMPDMHKGDIIGHESVGIVDDVGSDVKNFKKGDRVVISAIIACGNCEYCKRGEWSCCDTTNASEEQLKLYGHTVSGMFGYTHMTGGYDGCQAEYVRVPFGDVNLFPIPDDIDDKQALCLADVACTSYHGTELANVKEGDQVVIFGCGPVGLIAQMWSKYRGASRVIAIDVDAQRLEFAKTKFGSETINASEEDPVAAVQKLIPGGPDKVIDCVGSRLPESFVQKMKLDPQAEDDLPNIVNAAIKMVRKNGTITLVGDYVGYTNYFNLGALMEKHLTLNGGEQWPHKYYKIIFDAISKGAVDPSVVLTHTFPLSRCDEAYEQFDKLEGGLVKPFVLPDDIYNKL